jgi:cation transport ATPase
MGEARLAKTMTIGEGGLALAMVLAAFVCIFAAAKARDAPFAFHAYLGAAAAVAAVFAIFDRYFARPAEIPQEIDSRPNYQLGPINVFAVRQRLRPDAAAVVDRLKQVGLAVEIVSGDRVEAVAPVAARLGIDMFRAGMTPAEKIARIAALKAQGRRVLMVGDGLNDAPALAAAHVSLSPVTAVHLSQATADAVFLSERLAAVAAALAIAVRARRVMRANLWLAAGYNFVAVPLAILGFASPLVAALAMSGSSILVTANALRARPSRREAV